ncbi:nitroreductase family protein [Clostridium botulinum]|uniref:nitroreductase family protein n=1 Tax=Clostridium botulinum TaxID=1491 RepID=UPI0004D90BAF|nr:nitroreductase family protein [Clostridium botulinum]KEI09207.1 nitroreductase [Clostridium botulinum C/D str. BKT2873]QPW59690.1 nitroreductase family protein [Clostridium botulinum]
MEFYDVVKKRKSIKKFEQETIERDKLLKIIDMAMRAPSWKNMSPYKFIIVESENIKQDIANAIENRTSAAAESIINSPMTIVAVADPDVSGDVDGKEMYLIDTAIAMEHLVLGATDVGYGTCWIAAFDENKVKETLKIPENLRVVALTPLGIPTSSAEKESHNPKKDINDYLYLDRWDRHYMDSNVKVLINH